MTRRARRVPRGITVAAAAFMIVVVWLAAVADTQAPVPDSAITPASAVATRNSAVTVSRSSRGPASVFATMDGLALVLPHPHPLVVAYHESSRAQALPLRPVGQLLGRDDRTSAQGENRAASSRTAYRLLATEDGVRPTTGAADVAVPPGSTIAAPVTGRVVEVAQYPLSGVEEGDVRIVLQPERRPGLAVTLWHLQHPRVRVGDRVRAGGTRLATVRRLPFTTAVDAVVERPGAHVRVEVKAALESAPVDPNAPALPADVLP